MSGELTELELFTTSRSFAKFTSLAEFEGARCSSISIIACSWRPAPAAAASVLFAEEFDCPSSVCIELSERSDNSSAPDFPDLIAQMRRMGFKLAIDDFGTGHAR